MENLNNFPGRSSSFVRQLKILTATTLVASALSLHSQSIEPTIVASAGNLEIDPVTQQSLFWTVGDLAVETWSNGIRLTEGFHHIFFIITDIEEEILKELKIYPNPTDGWLQIDMESNEVFDISLFNLLGKKVLQKTNMRNSDRLDLSKLNSGTYLLSIIRDENRLETIKIIKT